MPFFTVIIPAYNRAPFLKIAVDSVRAQTFGDYELIVIDDGSQDNTQSLIRSYSDSRIRYYYQPNQGPAAARNAGISRAKGTYICFLDSDDRFRKNKLEVTRDFIEGNPDYKIFHSEEIWYRNGRLLPQKKHQRKPSGFIFENAAELCSVSISTAAVKKELFAQIGGFDPALPACEDYDFWLRATSRYPVYLIRQYLTLKEGGHPGQQSKKYPCLDKFRIYALEKILNSGSLSPKNKKAAYRCLRNKCLIYIRGAQKRKKNKEAETYRNILAKYSRR